MKRLVFWLSLILIFWLTIIFAGYFLRVAPQTLAGGGLAGLLFIGSGGVTFLAYRRIFGTPSRQRIHIFSGQIPVQGKAAHFRTRKQVSQKNSPLTLKHPTADDQKTESETSIDENRRLFLKAIGSLGFGALLLAIFKRNAAALSFGSTGYPDPVGLKHFSGTGADYSLTLTSADTSYQCPESANVPASDYILNIYNGSDTDVYWGWTSDISGTSALRRIIPTTGTLSIDLAASEYIHLVCDSASKTIAYGTKLRE